jgi:hypothetical protein
MTSARLFACLTVLLPLSIMGVACDSSPSGPVGGAVMGADDDHCDVAGTLTPVKVGMCETPTASDGGATEPDGGSGAVPELGETLFNAEGYDDECKYHVSWTSTPVRKNENVTFTVTIAKLDPAGPAEDADVEPEVFLDEVTPAPNTNPTSTETPAGSGIYKVGPIKFDKSGRWTVRFHMYDRCAEAPDSPHGHAAFYVAVP